MAEPQLQIEQRMDRLERAILKVGESLLSDDEKAEVETILQGAEAIKTVPPEEPT